MNHRIVLRILSRVAMVEALLIALCSGVAAAYGEPFLIPFLLPAAILAAVSLPLGLVKPRSKDFFAREGHVAVALSWLLLSVFGGLPFLFSGAIPSFVDCFFETVSGFTTTGASILKTVEHLPRGILFWRSFTHWIGGMGVLVFLMALMPLAGDRSIHLMRAESPGPSVGKMTPRTRSTASILYLIYLGMTFTQVVLLLLGGMPLYDSVCTAFGTAGTGGFSVKNASIEAYQSPYCEWVITIFMLLFSSNFIVFYWILFGKFRDALRCEEVRWYYATFAIATAMIVIDILPQARSLGVAIRQAAFQSSTIMSTTGFATTDFNQWPEFSHVVLVLLMIIGSCAGSTGGGFKMSRLVILLRSIRREVSRMLHPRSVGKIKFEGKSVDPEVSHGVLVYLGVYVVLVVVAILIVALDENDHLTTVTAVLATFNNIGPGLSIVGPTGNYSLFSGLSKVVLSLMMLLGRLEIFPMLALLSPALWRIRGKRTQ